MAALVGIIYGIDDRTIHAIHTRDNDADLGRIPLGTYEVMLKIPLSRYAGFPDEASLAAELIP